MNKYVQGDSLQKTDHHQVLMAGSDIGIDYNSAKFKKNENKEDRDPILKT